MHLTAWYDLGRIEKTVTRHFVCSQLVADAIEGLDTIVAFGDGLTNYTYWKWIKSRAKRLFLILADLDVPDQILV